MWCDIRDYSREQWRGPVQRYLHYSNHSSFLFIEGAEALYLCNNKMANFLFTAYNRNPLRFLFWALLIWVTACYIYIYSTMFTKDIRVSNRGMSGGYRTTYNTVLDDKGVLYRFANNGLLLHYSAAHVAATVQDGGHYRVSGYGMNWPALGIYPNILTATKMPA